MAVSTGNEYLWAFIYWAERNPFDSLSDVHWDEIKEMVKLFNRVNVTDGGTATETDPESYGTDVDVPGKTTDNDDTNGISFDAPSAAICSQSRYPESHMFTAAGT